MARAEGIKQFAFAEKKYCIRKSQENSLQMLYIQMLQKECKGMQSAVPESTHGKSTAQRASSWHKILRRCDSTTPNHQRLCTALQTAVVENPKGQRQKHYDIIMTSLPKHLNSI